MIVNKYLFTPYNVPQHTKDKINMMNRELIERMTIVAKKMHEEGADISLFDDISQMVSEEIFIKYN